MEINKKMLKKIYQFSKKANKLSIRQNIKHGSLIENDLSLMNKFSENIHEKNGRLYIRWRGCMTQDYYEN